MGYKIVSGRFNDKGKIYQYLMSDEEAAQLQKNSIIVSGPSGISGNQVTYDSSFVVTDVGDVTPDLLNNVVTKQMHLNSIAGSNNGAPAFQFTSTSFDKAGIAKALRPQSNKPSDTSVIAQSKRKTMELNKEWRDIGKVLEEITSTPKQFQDAMDTLTGEYMAKRGKQWSGSFANKSSKYSTTGKTRDQAKQIQHSTDLSDTKTAQESIEHIVSFFEQQGYAVLGRVEQTLAGLQNLALQVVPAAEKNFFAPEGRGTKLGIKPHTFNIPITKNGRIYYDSLERDNIVYPTADANGVVKMLSAVETGLRRAEQQMSYGRNAAQIHGGTAAGASNEAVRQAYRVIERITNQQMRSAVNPGSAMSQYNPDVLSELQESFALEGSTYRENVIESGAYLDHMFDAILNKYVHGTDRKSTADQRNRYLQQISKMSLLMRAKGPEAALKEIRHSSEFKDIIGSDLGTPVVDAITQLYQMGTAMGPVSDSNGLKLTYMRGLDRALQFLLPPSSRKSYQTELNSNDFASANREFSHNKGAVIRSAWEAANLSGERLSGKEYDTTRLLPITQEQLAGAMRRQRAAGVNPNTYRDELLSVAGDAMILDREAAVERFGYETITKRVANELIRRKYEALAQSAKDKNKKVDQRALAKKAVREVMHDQHGARYSSKSDLLTYGPGEQGVSTELDRFIDEYFTPGKKGAAGKFTFDTNDETVFGIRKLAKLQPNSIADNVKWVTPGAEMRVAAQVGNISALLPYLAEELGVSPDDLQGVSGLIEAKQYSAKNLVTPISGLINDVFGTYQKKYRRDPANADKAAGQEYLDFVNGLLSYLPANAKVQNVVRGIFGTDSIVGNMLAGGAFTESFVQTADLDIQKDFKKYSPLIMQALGYLETGGNKGLLTPLTKDGAVAFSGGWQDQQEALLQAIESGAGSQLSYSINTHPLALQLLRHAGATYGAAGSKNGYPATYGYREFDAIKAQIGHAGLAGNQVSAIDQYYKQLAGLTELSKSEYDALLQYERNAERNTWALNESGHNAAAIEAAGGVAIDMAQIGDLDLIGSLEEIRDKNSGLFDAEKLQNNTMIGYVQKRQREKWDALATTEEGKKLREKYLAQAGGAAAVARLVKKMTPAGAQLTEDEQQQQLKAAERMLGASMIPYAISSGNRIFGAVDPSNPDAILSKFAFGAHIGANYRLNDLGDLVADVGPVANTVERFLSTVYKEANGIISYDSDLAANQAMGQMLYNMQTSALQDLTQHGKSTFDKSHTTPLAHSMMPATLSVDGVGGEYAKYMENAVVISPDDMRQLLQPTAEEEDLIKAGTLKWSDWLKNYYLDIVGENGATALKQLESSFEKELKAGKGWDSLSAEKQAKRYEGRWRNTLTEDIISRLTLGSENFSSRGALTLLNRFPSIMGRTDVRAGRMFVNNDWKGMTGKIGGDESFMELFNADYDGDHMVLSLLGSDGRVYKIDTDVNQQSVLAQGRGLLGVQQKETALARFLSSARGAAGSSTVAGVGIKAGSTDDTTEQDNKDIFMTKTGKAKVGPFSYLRQGFANAFANAGILSTRSHSVDAYRDSIAAEAWNALWAVPEQKTISAKKSGAGESDIDWFNDVENIYKTLRDASTVESETKWSHAIDSMIEQKWLSGDDSGLLDMTDMAQARSMYSLIAKVVEMSRSAKGSQTKNLQTALNSIFGKGVVNAKDLQGLRFKDVLDDNGKTTGSIEVDDTLSDPKAIAALGNIKFTKQVALNLRSILDTSAKRGHIAGAKGIGDFIRDRYDFIPGLSKDGILYNKDRKVFSEDVLQALARANFTVNEQKNGIVDDERLREYARDWHLSEEVRALDEMKYGGVGGTLFNREQQADWLLGQELKSNPIVQGGHGTSATRISQLAFPHYFKKPQTADYRKFYENFGMDAKDHTSAQDLGNMFKDFQTFEGGNLAHTAAQTMLEAAQQGYYTLTAEDISGAGVRSFIEELNNASKKSPRNAGLAAFVQGLSATNRSAINPEGEVGLSRAIEDYGKMSSAFNPFYQEKATPIDNLLGLGKTFALSFSDYLGVTGDAQKQRAQIGPSEAVMLAKLGETPMYVRADMMGYRLADMTLPGGGQGAERLTELRNRASQLGVLSKTKAKQASVSDIRAAAEKYIKTSKYTESNKKDIDSLLQDAHALVPKQRLQTVIEDFKTTGGSIAGGLSEENVVQGFALKAAAEGMQEALRKSGYADRFLGALQKMRIANGGDDAAAYGELLDPKSALSQTLESDITNMLNAGANDAGDVPAFIKSLMNMYAELTPDEARGKIAGTLRSLLVGAGTDTVDTIFSKGSTTDLSEGTGVYHLKAGYGPLMSTIFGKLLAKRDDLTMWEHEALKNAQELGGEKRVFSSDIPSKEADAFMDLLNSRAGIYKKYYQAKRDEELANNNGNAIEAQKQKELAAELAQQLGSKTQGLDSSWRIMSAEDRTHFKDMYGLSNYAGNDDDLGRRFDDLSNYDVINKTFGTDANAKKWRRTQTEIDQIEANRQALSKELARYAEDSEDYQRIQAELNNIGDETTTGSVLHSLYANKKIYESYFDTPERDAQGNYIFDENGDFKLGKSARFLLEQMRYNKGHKEEAAQTEAEQLDEYKQLQMQRAGLIGEKSYLQELQRGVRAGTQHLSDAEQAEIAARLKEIDTQLTQHVLNRLNELQAALMRTDENGKSIPNSDLKKWDKVAQGEIGKSKATQGSRATAAALTQEQRIYNDASKKYGALNNAEYALWAHDQKMGTIKDPTEKRLMELERERLVASRDIAQANVTTMETEAATGGAKYSAYVGGLQSKAKEEAGLRFEQNKKAYTQNEGAKPQGVFGKLEAKIGGFAKSMISGYGLYTAFAMIRQAMSKLVAESKELDKALTNLRIVTGETKSETRNLISQYSDLATQLGATTTEVANSAVAWLRQGYSTSEAMQLVTSSMYLSTLGMIDSATATKSLTSALKGFKLQATDSMSIVDKLTALDLKAATSAGDIAEGLAQFANIGSLSGVNIDEAAAYVATISDVTQMTGSSAGQALKTIISRYGNVKAGAYNKLNVDSDTVGDTTLNDVEKVLKKLGITVRDSNLQFKDFDVVLEEIAERWDSLDTVSQKAVATTFAGVRQQEAFVTLLQNWDKYEDLLKASQDSSGTAEKKYSSYKESLQASEKALTAALEGVVNSAEVSELLREITDGLTVLVKDLLPGLIKWLPQFFFFMQDIRSFSGNSILQNMMRKSGADVKLESLFSRNTVDGKLKYKSLFADVGSGLKNKVLGTSQKGSVADTLHEKWAAKRKKVDAESVAAAEEKAALEQQGVTAEREKAAAAAQGREAEQQKAVDAQQGAQAESAATTQDQAQLAAETASTSQDQAQLAAETSSTAQDQAQLTTETAQTAISRVGLATSGSGASAGAYQDVNGRWHGANGQFIKAPTTAATDTTGGTSTSGSSKGTAGGVGAITMAATLALSSISSALTTYATAGTTHKAKDYKGEEISVESSEAAKKEGKAWATAFAAIPLIGPAVDSIFQISEKAMQAIDRDRDARNAADAKSEAILSTLVGTEGTIQTMASSIKSSDADTKQVGIDAAKEFADTMYNSENKETRLALQSQLTSIYQELGMSNGELVTINKVVTDYTKGDSRAAKALEIAAKRLEIQEHVSSKVADMQDYRDDIGIDILEYNATRDGYNDQGISDEAYADATGAARLKATGVGVTAGIMTFAASAFVAGAMNEWNPAGWIITAVGAIAGAAGLIVGAIETKAFTDAEIAKAQQEEIDAWNRKSLDQQIEKFQEDAKNTRQQISEFEKLGNTISDDDANQLTVLYSQLETQEKLLAAYEDYRDYMQSIIDEDNQLRLEEALLETRDARGNYILDMNIAQAAQLGTTQLLELLAQQSAKNGGLYGIDTYTFKDSEGNTLNEQQTNLLHRYLSGDIDDADLNDLDQTDKDIIDQYTSGKYTKELSTRFEEAALSVLKTDDELAAAISGESYTLNEALSKFSDSSDKYDLKLLQNFANALGTTVDELKNLANDFGTLTLGEMLKSTSDLITEYEGYDDLLSSITDSTASATKWMSTIISTYPELIQYMSDTPTLISKIMAKLRDLTTLEFTSQWSELADSDKFYESTIQTDIRNYVKTNYSDKQVADIDQLMIDSGATTLSELVTYLNGYDVKSLTVTGSDGTQQLNNYKILYDALSQAGSEYELTSDSYKKSLENFINYNSTLLGQQINNLSQQKDALQQITSQREYENRLIEAKLRLENTINEKSRVYRAGVGFVYEADQGAIAEAQKELEEVQIEKDVSAITKQIEILQGEKDEWDNIWEQKSFELQEQQAIAFQQEYMPELNGTIGSLFDSLTEDEKREAGLTRESVGDAADSAVNATNAGNAFLAISNDYLLSVKTNLEGYCTYFKTYTQKQLEAEQTAKKQAVTAVETAWNNYQTVRANGGSTAAQNSALKKYQQQFQEASSKGYISSTSSNGETQDNWVSDAMQEYGTNNTKYAAYGSQESYDMAHKTISDGEYTWMLGDKSNTTDLDQKDTLWQVKGSLIKISNGEEYSDWIAGDVRDSLLNDKDHKNSQNYARIWTADNYKEGGEAFSKTMKSAPVPLETDTLESYAGRLYDRGINSAIIVGARGGDEWVWIRDGVPYQATAAPASQGGYKDSSNYVWAYAHGTLGVDGQQTALINELGTEAIITPSGTITSLPSQTGVVPADITKNLWALGGVAPNILRVIDSINPRALSGAITSNSSSAVDESLNISNFTMQVNADNSFDADAFVQSLKSRVALTRNTRR